MKKFLAVFTSNAEKMAALNQHPDVQQISINGVAAWHQWMADNKSAILKDGDPLSRTTRVSPTGTAEVRNNLGGYLQIQAESPVDTAKLFLDHPSFTIFPGEAVEIMEILSIPVK